MSSLVDEYRRHAIDHGAYLTQDDADSSNVSYDRLQDAFHAIIKARGRRELFKLYDDVDESVQCWAAAHTLEVDEGRALAKLKQLEKSENPYIRIDAEYTSREWKNGALKFFPHSEDA
jgi:hypothetical protein